MAEPLHERPGDAAVGTAGEAVVVVPARKAVMVNLITWRRRSREAAAACG